MKHFYVITVLFLTFPALIYSQTPEMEKLSFLIGEWEGSGWAIMGPGERHEFIQTENVTWKIDHELILIEGIGYQNDENRQKMHQAIAMVYYDNTEERYRMVAYRSGTYHMEMGAEMDGNKFIWTMRPPGAGLVRYTTTLNDQGQWFEIGEISRDDGNSWFQFFEMTLTRIESDGS